MIVLHQIHQVSASPSTRRQFASLFKEDWLPALAGDADARLLWYAEPSASAIHSDEVVSMIAVRDGTALDRLGSSLRTGALAGLAHATAKLRSGVQTRLLKALDYDPSGLDFDAIPTTPVTHPAALYMHDFVPPVIGQNRAYGDMMRARYMDLSSQELSGVVLRLSWETVAGGGPMPEMFNLSQIRDVDALIRLLTVEIPAEYKKMGSWMWEALAVRDRWTTRLMSCSDWSPIA
jgi:hypothetical protein